MDSRSIKARAIVETDSFQKKRKGIWIAPSQRTGLKPKFPYEVNTASKPKTCTCPDFELRGLKCKHILAAELVASGRTSFRAPDLNEPIRPTYPQNWTAYNAAQTNEKTYVASMLQSLCAGVEEPAQTKGRPRMPLSEMIFAMTMKVYGRHSGRRSTCDMKEYENKSLLENAPHFNTISKYFEKPELTPILKALIMESASPLVDVETHFSADSSGFALTNMSNWNNEKWGKYGKQQKGHDWLELHAMIGAKTNVITGVVITGQHGGDAKQFPELLEATAQRFRVNEVSGDKAYLSARNFEVAAKFGATPLFPFKSNSIPDGVRSTDLWRKAYYYFQYKRDEFLPRYHKRSNVETTFSMIKRKFGEQLRSKTRVAQENELLCKCLCHNLAVLVHEIFELGIEVEFWGDSQKQVA